MDSGPRSGWRGFLGPHGGAAVIGLIGVGIRALYAFPAHRFASGSDSVLTGLAAFRILRGHPTVFYSGVRQGAFESYLHAVVFSIFGISYGTLAVAPLVSGSLVLLFFYLWLAETWDPRPARLALLFLALPSPAYLFWTYLPIGYAETILFSVAALWLSARIANGDGRKVTAFAFGLAVGLGWWNCFLSLAVTIPAIAWILLRRWRFSRPGLLLAGFLLGALPWIAYNVRHPLASFHEGFGARPAASAAAAASNLRHFLGYDIPELAVSRDPTDGGTGPVTLFSEFAWPLAAAVEAAALVLFALRIAQRLLQRERPRSLDLLVPGLILATAFLNTFSAAGQHSHLSVRYVLPLALVLPILLATLVADLNRISRWLGLFATTGVLAFHLSAYLYPWTPARRTWRENSFEEARLVQFLHEKGVRFVAGDYWSVYPIDFLSGESIKSIPLRASDDIQRVESRLEESPVRMAIVASNGQSLQAVLGCAGLSGRSIRLGPTTLVCLPDGNPPGGLAPRDILRRIRKACRRPKSSSVS